MNKKIIKDDKYNIKFEDKEYLEDILFDNDIDISPEELCFQLTAYESNGDVNYKQGISEILSDNVDKPEYYDYIKYCEENNYDYPVSIDEFDDWFANEKPFVLAQKVYYGDFNPGWHKYFMFDGKGNIQGYESLEEVYENDSDFINWYYENKLSDLIYDEDFKKDILNGVRQLLEEGY